MDDPIDGRVMCPVCPRACRLAEGQLGACGARRARDGRMVDENYGRVTALALDPIEKKPLARFRPGTRVLSVGSYGCNLRCPFCQNASIACARADDVAWEHVSPAQLVERADDLRERGNIGLAFTYNEPLVGYEFVRDAAALARERGLATVLVSNGCVNPGPLAELAPLLDAANIDLKGFTQDFYDLVGGDLSAVKRTIATLAAQPGCHLEVTTLIIPGLNDTDDEMDAAARWLASLDPAIPYHVTRFFPCHRMADRPATPVATVRRLADVARRHLRHVYVGNC
ncbi:MAG: AmmeMemoRadiSam system radical SAM enzyme [Eggerthellaceae bacterium]|nr:AmmeMemoRadiSam system radical SAM enzyme [Eggerthellaceae bacterium]